MKIFLIIDISFLGKFHFTVAVHSMIINVGGNSGLPPKLENLFLDFALFYKGLTQIIFFSKISVFLGNLETK